MTDDSRISITICGDGGCGKSSITLRLVRSQWTQEYDPTIEDSYSVTRTIDGHTYHLSLTDTAGQEEYRGLWAASNLRSDAFLLVYDITQSPTLDALDYFLQMIDMECDHRQDSGGVLPVKMVAGNKCDLKDSRQIPAAVGLQWARDHGCGFMETSAREMVNIEETFALIIRRVVAARQLHAQQQQQQQQRPQQLKKSPSKLGLFPQRQSPTRPQASSSSPHLLSKEAGSAFDFADGPGDKRRMGFWGRLKCW